MTLLLPMLPWPLLQRLWRPQPPRLRQLGKWYRALQQIRCVLFQWRHFLEWSITFISSAIQWLHKTFTKIHGFVLACQKCMPLAWVTWWRSTSHFLGKSWTTQTSWPGFVRSKLLFLNKYWQGVMIGRCPMPQHPSTIFAIDAIAAWPFPAIEFAWTSNIATNASSIWISMHITSHDVPSLSTQLSKKMLGKSLVECDAFKARRQVNSHAQIPIVAKTQDQASEHTHTTRRLQPIISTSRVHWAAAESSNLNGMSCWHIILQFNWMMPEPVWLAPRLHEEFKILIRSLGSLKMHVEISWMSWRNLSTTSLPSTQVLCQE